MCLGMGVELEGAIESLPAVLAWAAIHLECDPINNEIYEIFLKLNIVGSRTYDL